MLNERIKNGQENHQVISCGKPGLFCACKAWTGLQNRPSVCGFLFISLKIYGKIKNTKQRRYSCYAKTSLTGFLTKGGILYEL